MAKLSGEIGHMGILDLTWAKTPEDLSGITKLTQIGVIRVPEHLYQYVLAIPSEKVGLIEPSASGPRTDLVGQNRVTGEFLANGDPETTLQIMGQAIVMPPVSEVAFKRIDIMGQLILPEGSEGEISRKLGSVKGQIVYCSFEHGMPRVFFGDEEVGREFIELLDAPVAWVILGHLTLEPDVTADLLKAKVPQIVLCGKLPVPPALKTICQVLATDKTGEIHVIEDTE